MQSSGDIEQRYKEYFYKARRNFQTADHMAYVTLSVLKENRLLIKIIHELSKSALNLIRAFLWYEYAYKRIKLYHHPDKNLKTFKEKIATKYLNNNEINDIIRVIDVERKHRQARMDFVKKEKFVIFLGEKYEIITTEIVKKLLNSVRNAINKFPADFT